MGMIDDEGSPLAFAVRALADVKLIDGGDTVDVRLLAADDRMVAVLIPRRVFKELQAAVLPDTNTDARR
ncbi:hypothetical protein MHIMP23_01610 [Methylobacterium hispanicum]